ncbi:hypothetical protein Btru_065307 [Bulinus truncatus]|nr:hypothetical protein Btru_065307 [Bulinus truncatus]
MRTLTGHDVKRRMRTLTGHDVDRRMRTLDMIEQLTGLVISKLSHQQTKVVSQIDLCPTLSTLLGIPIPNNNIGKVITDALHGFTVLQKLTVLNSNAIQVVQVFKKYYPEFEKDSTYQLYKKTTSQFNTWKVSKNSTDTTIWEKEGYSLLLMYTECLTAIAHKIQSLSTQYDIYILAVSMVLLWMLFAVIFIHLLQDTQNSYSAPLSTYVYQICLVFGTAVLSHIVMCTGAVPSELMCRSTYVSISIQIVMAFIFIVCSVYLLNKLPSCHWSQIIKWRQHNTMTEMFLAVGSVVHMCTYFSSSYIEEEHQTFYFISTGVHVVLILHLIYLYFLYNSNTEPYFLNTALCQKSSDGRHGDYHKKQCSELNRCKDCLILLCNILIILILLRALRRWNQTGNKWLDVPDIGDWLVLPDNKLYLSMCVAFSLIIIGVTRGHQVNRLQSLLINLSLTITYFYRVATGHLFSPKSTFLSLRGIVEARTTFFLIAMTFISSALPSAFFNLENKDLTAFELNTIGNQKCRPHNIPVVMMLSIIEQMIIPVLIKVSLKLPYTLLYCQLMGQSFFFFQGNSNSLSTLDLTAGYTGLNEFNPFITGFHICLSTFSGTIFWSLTFLKVCCLMSYDKKYHSEAKMYLDVTRSVSTLLLSLSSRSSLYTSLIAIQRHHLFIWTVFSPKLLYESVYIIVHSILICFTSMFLKLKQNLL